MTNRININRIHFPITSLGYGSRVGIWFQGCRIQCPGCVSRDTWQSGLGQINLDQVTELISPWVAKADGLTLSGGEPFDQHAALALLVRWWRQHCQGDIFVFSGYTSETLWRQHASIVSEIDVLLSDPFDETQLQSKPLRGSDNQRMHLLSPLAQQRYATLSKRNTLDVCFDGETVWIAGIPKPSDLAEIRQRLQAMGISVNTSNQLSEGVRA